LAIMPKFCAILWNSLSQRSGTPWHFKYQICIVRHCQESRKCGSSEDRVILRWPVHDFEV
jgi:hypothetical protein